MYRIALPRSRGKWQVNEQNERGVIINMLNGETIRLVGAIRMQSK
ncbi:hypothetical protein [Neobacillus vireti]